WARRSSVNVVRLVAAVVFRKCEECDRALMRARLTLIVTSNSLAGDSRWFRWTKAGQGVRTGHGFFPS
ncbi:MAG TPA: hypothetical protein PL065_00335, partial [Polyangiaceae bacterium]|nr:hypothetical protein [Polyangiaceae bacterium]